MRPVTMRKSLHSNPIWTVKFSAPAQVLDACSWIRAYSGGSDSGTGARHFAATCGASDDTLAQPGNRVNSGTVYAGQE